MQGGAHRSTGTKLAVRIAELEKQIYEEAGEEFNINSPKQLGVILFEKLSHAVWKENKDRLFHGGGCAWTSLHRNIRWLRIF